MGDKPIDKLAAAIAPLQEALDSDTSELVETTEPGSDTESELLADSESPESSDGVNETDVKLEESDDAGVPYKNRFAEANRKIQRFESKIQELEEQLKSLSQKTPDQTLSSLRPSFDQQRTADVPPAPTPVGDPDAPVTRAELSGFAQSMALKTERDKIESAVLRDYPELNDERSDLFRETKARIDHSLRMGRNPLDPRLILDAVEAAELRLIKDGKRTFVNKKADENERRTAVAGQKTLTSRGTVTKGGSSNQPTKMEKFVLTKFKNAGVQIDPAKYFKRKNSR